MEGLGGIKVKLIKHSVGPTGIPIYTFECDYHRYVHGEVMTHRLFSRNAMSSRAVPIGKMIELVEDYPAIPIHWGANQAGMQAHAEVEDKEAAEKAWLVGRDLAVATAKSLEARGLHKQIVNRPLEAYQMIRVIITTTDISNFLWLREHEDAAPEIAELARLIRLEVENSEPQVLVEGQWHLPYVELDEAGYYIVGSEGERIDLTELDAIKVSVSCCAQVSYRLLDNSLEKALRLYDRLVGADPKHASCLEHQARAIPDYDDLSLAQVANWELGHEYKGVTHFGKDCELYSGNLKGWVQYRQTIETHDNVKKYTNKA